MVDDSALIRRWLRVVLEAHPRLSVVGEAEDAQAARKVIKATRPDVVTLDIEMPGMDGLGFLERLMRLNPLPVVMVSGMTSANSDATVRALMLGAVDCIEKPMTGTDARQRAMIARRVFAAAFSRLRSRPHPPHTPVRPSATRSPGNEPVILIGASTGGVAALDTLIGGLDPWGPPVVIVQHMPGPYLVSFSNLLDRTFHRQVSLAQQGMSLSPGQVALAPALGQHAEVVRRSGRWEIRLAPDVERSLHCPSVDRLFHSAVPWAPHVIAAILTGLGRDGARGLKALRDAGALTFAQDEESSTVYGMPRVAWEIGAASEQVALDDLAGRINDAERRYRQRQGEPGR
ncbi:hypothetical protein BOO69_08820 [Sulfitobacter alexandrii]|uniref:protein-glutamate methylesterase n=1 Tax=Sulfitobacter alexandrii TaxID=1917485 RepID=A0A1J0WMA5_9RHOB|nr:hypothetical protein BOO69_08820 [Sulfitobacter alexandrii]